MAIDTEDKRMSMLSWHTGRKVPQPDGALDQNDRQTLLGRYGGILWEAIVSAVTPAIRTIITAGYDRTIVIGSEDRTCVIARDYKDEIAQ